MTSICTIALDAMGGDRAPDMVIAGADRAHHRNPRTRFRFFGDQAVLEPMVASRPRLAACSEVCHAEEVVAAADKPAQALRRGRNSSMRLAIDAVAEGRAGGVVSAGNTGALMAMSKVVLKTLPGIDRPAIASFLPTERGETVMLDLGANVESDASNLVQFAVMGANFAHSVLGRVRPLVGLLNVGVENVKGHDEVKAAAELLRNARDLPFAFHGFVEGDDITKGTVDVVVTDGFTGNVALKTAEGAARLVAKLLEASFRQSTAAKIGYLLARPAVEALRARLDPRHYNGGVLLGLNGIVVKSHGGTDEVGFANAVCLAIDMVGDQMIQHTVADFQNLPTGKPIVAATAAAVPS